MLDTKPGFHFFQFYFQILTYFLIFQCFSYSVILLSRQAIYLSNITHTVPVIYCANNKKIFYIKEHFIIAFYRKYKTHHAKLHITYCCFSNVSSSETVLGLNTFPAKLNSLSTGQWGQVFWSQFALHCTMWDHFFLLAFQNFRESIYLHCCQLTNTHETCRFILLTGSVHWVGIKLIHSALTIMAPTSESLHQLTLRVKLVAFHFLTKGETLLQGWEYSFYHFW